MGRSFQDLRKRMSPERQARAHERADRMLAEMLLQELRRERHLTQQALAAPLGSNQARVSKLERRADMLVSSLRSYVEALGGSLEIVARFPDGPVRIRQFDRPGPAHVPSARTRARPASHSRAAGAG